MFKVLLSAFLFVSAAANAQSVSREEANKLAMSLPNSATDTTRINILLKIAKYHVFKTGENKTDLDSATRLIEQAEKLNLTIKSAWANGYIVLIKAYLHKEKGQLEKAKEAAQNAVNILQNTNDTRLIADSYFELSGYYSYYDLKELDERIRLMELAHFHYQQMGDMERIGTSRYVLGDLYHIRSDNFKALGYLKSSLVAFDSANHTRVQGVYILMGTIYAFQGDNKRALDYGLLALKTAENVGDTSMQLCQINNGIGRTLVRLNERQRAIGYLYEALKVAEKYNDNISIYVVATNIANNWIGLGDATKALRILKNISSKHDKPQDPAVDFNINRCYLAGYSMLKQYDKAEPYCNQLLATLDEPGASSFVHMEIFAAVIKFYIAFGQHGPAVKYLNKHKELAENANDISLMAANHKFWFMLDTARHNYQSAIEHLLNSNRLNDSLFNETKSRQIAELEIQFETERKEKDILVKDQSIRLLTQQDELQKNKLRQGAILRNVNFAAVALLIIIMALLYNRYRLRQRTNRKLQLQQDEIAKQNDSLHHLVNEKDWLLKEIHHRVKNNLQIVMSLLNSQSAYIDNEPALTAIHDSQHRVHAMSLIHQKLYNSENVSSIDMLFYIRELVSYLADSFNTGQRIRFALDIEPLEMDVGQAVPLGLILNEAITNAIKYAFPDGRDGIISISLSSTGAHNYLLKISDNGIGIPPQNKNKKTGSLGMSLIAGLSEDLDGSFVIESNNQGTTIKVSFVYDQQVNRPNNLTAELVSNN